MCPLPCRYNTNVMREYTRGEGDGQGREREERAKGRKMEGFEVSRCVVYACSEIALKNVRNKGGRVGHVQVTHS